MAFGNGRGKDQVGKGAREWGGFLELEGKWVA